MSFVAAPPESAQDDPGDTVAGGAWWPDVSIAAFLKAVRISSDVTPDRARPELIAAMIDVARDLRCWHEAQTAASLAQVEQEQIGGEGAKVSLWRRAVYALAAANLADTHNDISATEAARERNEIRATAADEHRRNATQAIRAIKGLSRNRVALK